MALCPKPQRHTRPDSLSRCAVPPAAISSGDALRHPHLEWKHVDFETAELRTPRDTTKGTRTYHIVPHAI